MTDCKLMINGININRSQMKLDVAIACSYDSETPKIRVVFEREGEVRRLPLAVRGTFRRKERNDTINICAYTYLLDYVFTEFKDGQFTIGFDISFGDEVVEKPEIVFSRGFTEEDIDNNYLAGEDFDGSTMFVNTSIESEQEITGKYIYSYTALPEEGKILVTASENKEVINSGIKSAVSSIFGIFVAAFNMICCFILLPHFVITGVLAGLDLIQPRKYPPCETIKARIIGQIKANISAFLRYMFKGKDVALKFVKYRETFLKKKYEKLCKKPVVQNRISFISGRRNEMGGNEEYVYNLIKDKKDIDFQFLFCEDLDRLNGGKKLKRFYELYATSKVVIVDDYIALLNGVKKRDDVTLFQLWHACGAFKTFGFSRLGKPGGPKQTTPSHRMYDYTIVSSGEIAKYYAEGFGIDDKKVLPTGIPRTDIFFDEEYASRVRNDFYDRYPGLKSKKIVMFAPTFRGDGQKNAYYPTSVFEPNDLYEKIGDEYAIIIKLHPFCKEKFSIKEEYADKIIDLSENDEINDLLFVTDLLITDYSSTIFEASLLNIPMVFYAYDLYQYITDRDFYCNFTSFVPGKIVFTEGELSEVINNNDFEIEKVEPFKNKFFAHTDGKSSQRVADAIIKALVC